MFEGYGNYADDMARDGLRRTLKALGVIKELTFREALEATYRESLENFGRSIEQQIFMSPSTFKAIEKGLSKQLEEDKDKPS